MHNWKWVNLSKMTGFNISLSLNERQSSSDKKYNKSLRLVLFIPFRCCFAGSLPFSLSTVKQTKLSHSISEMFFSFLARKTLWVKLFSLNVCEAALQAAVKSGNFGAKLTHLCASDWTYHFSHTWKNIVHDADWTYHFFLVSYFSVRSSRSSALLRCVKNYFGGGGGLGAAPWVVYTLIQDGCP